MKNCFKAANWHHSKGLFMIKVYQVHKMTAGCIKQGKTVYLKTDKNIYRAQVDFSDVSTIRLLEKF